MRDQLQLDTTPEEYDDLTEWAAEIHGRVWPVLEGPDRPLAMAAFLSAVAERGAVGRRDGDEPVTFLRMFFADHLVDVAVSDTITVAASSLGGPEYVGPLESLPRAVLLDAAHAAEELRYAQSLRTLSAAAARASEIC